MVQPQAVLVQYGPEHVGRGALGLGLDPDGLARGQVQAEQHTPLQHHLLAAQAAHVRRQVQGLKGGLHMELAYGKLCPMAFTYEPKNLH